MPAPSKAQWFVIALGVFVVGSLVINGRRDGDAAEAAKATAPSAAKIDSAARARKAAEDEKAAQERRAVLVTKCATQADAFVAESRKLYAAGQDSDAAMTLAPCHGLPSETAASKLLWKQINATRDAKIAKAAREEEREQKTRKKREGVRIGMSKQDALDSSWGKPERVNTTTTALGTREQWVYGSGGYLYFVGGVLTTIQN